MHKNEEFYWKKFIEWAQLSKMQLEQFQKYFNLLIEWNKKFNLTTITNIKSVLNYHFKDSLFLTRFIDMNRVGMLADIGAGAGFPSIPIKILYPDLSVVLIEVNKKRISFLKLLCRELALKNIEIYPLDWRTFLRKTNYPIEIFLARASLRTNELFRMFKPSCVYKESVLIYYASSSWKPDEKEKRFLEKEEIYNVGNRRRKIIFFKGKI